MINTKFRTNLLDLFILLCIFFSITGYILARAEKTSLNKLIEGKEKIGIEVYIPDVHQSGSAYTTELFKVGNKSAITIRNRPYTQLEIIKTEIKQKTTLLPNLSGSFKVIKDPTKNHLKDYYVTLTDIALKTKDGFVIGGNKIKTGNPVELEGFNYRLNGKVINIYTINEEEHNQEHK